MKSRFCAHQVCWFWCVVALTQVPAWAQQPPFDVYPPAEPPYYRIRYEASTKPGELIFPVNYTIWIPPEVETLRGIVVHQHGCGEGSCSSGLSGAYDLHWQALARKHNCALFAPAYEQPQKADCQMWCDPRNGSAKAFQRGLEDLGDLSGHPELGHLPGALWGHSGGGHWAGGMTLLFPERTIASWLRSGVPLLEENPKRPQIKPHDLPETALADVVLLFLFRRPSSAWVPMGAAACVSYRRCRPGFLLAPPPGFLRAPPWVPIGGRPGFLLVAALGSYG